MAEQHKYTSLSDILKDQPPKPLREESEEIPLVTEMFGELYFRESPSSTSIGDLKFTPPLPLPKVSTTNNENLNDDNKIKNLVEKKNLPENDSCMYNNSTRLFPPPISALKMSKNGKPFTYQRFDETANAFVGEELNIHPESVMAASRENESLRMKFADHHGQEGEEEKEEAMGAFEYDDGEKSDDEES
ncbi:hypothetical protein ACH5RR_019045 [Cinchona calisaya]|uniref:Uncharacterized protein n=1 Tax=Cinchona calisaya TaxID=153742 RepID=A0ABD2ZN79_9GENT